MMTCRRIEETYSAYRDGDQAPAEREAYEAHLEECTDCQLAVGQWDDVLADLTELGGFEVPADFASQVLSRIDPPASVAPTRRRFLPFAMTALAASVLTAGISYLLWNRGEASGRVERPAIDWVRVEAVVGSAEFLDRSSGDWQSLDAGMQIAAPVIVRGSGEGAQLALAGRGSRELAGNAVGCIEPDGELRMVSHPVMDSREQIARENVSPRPRRIVVEWPDIRPEAVTAVLDQLDWTEVTQSQSRVWNELARLISNVRRLPGTAFDRLQHSPMTPSTKAPAESQDWLVTGPLVVEGPKVSTPPDRSKRLRDPSSPAVLARTIAFEDEPGAHREQVVIRRLDDGQLEIVTRGSYAQRIPLLLDVLANDPTVRDLARSKLEEILGELERNASYRSANPSPFPKADGDGALAWIADRSGLPPSLVPDSGDREDADILRRWNRWWLENRSIVQRVGSSQHDFF
ncbi:MAG: zf-HC2 domain-containing protein [Planctomycetota bacterium]